VYLSRATPRPLAPESLGLRVAVVTGIAVPRYVKLPLGTGPRSQDSFHRPGPAPLRAMQP